MLPDELVKVLDIIGVAWPDIDEDEIRSSADDYRALASGLRDAVKDGNTAHSHLVGGRSKGKTVAAVDARWTKLAQKDLGPFADALDTLAGALDECAGLIEGCKYICIAELTATAATATAGIVGAIFTLGASTALSAAAVAACRLAVKEAISYAVGMITDIVTEKIEAMVLAELERILTEHVGGGGHQDGGGMRVNGLEPGAGPSSGADSDDELVVVEEEFEQTASDLDKARKNFDDKKKTHRTSGGKRRSSVKKDSRFHKLATVIDKCEDVVDKKIDDVIEVVDRHQSDIKRAKKDQKERDLDAKKKMDDVDTPDEERMYLLNSDGTVVEIYRDGTVSKTPVSRNEAIVGDLLEPDGTYWRPNAQERQRYRVADAGPEPGRVRSRKLAPGEKNDLAHATQLARHAQSYYKGRNYAAARYLSEDGKSSVIIVGHSEGRHSERVLGYPLLRHEQGGRVSELYTEREPCQKMPKCDQWLYQHFPSDLQVTHTADYDQQQKNQDKEHREYRTALENFHKEHGPGQQMTRR
ncbi:nucleic acid/nucleotide deaminase domain-containing protein [Streptomyces sp. NPDC005012]|uniref:nucleic acid/nucleotide deaminase domain-containing protein n=1 Tax=unclassified Streptomyces TaxID=2593676 RepID=UPI0033A5A5DC